MSIPSTHTPVLKSQDSLTHIRCMQEDIILPLLIELSLSCVEYAIMKLLLDSLVSCIMHYLCRDHL